MVSTRKRKHTSSSDDGSKLSDESSSSSLSIVPVHEQQEIAPAESTMLPADESSNRLPLNDFLMCKIVQLIPFPQRVELESVSRQFRTATLFTYRFVKRMNIGDMLKSGAARDVSFKSNKRLRSILLKLCRYFPNVQDLSGLWNFADTLTWGNFRSIARLPKLSAICFEKCRFIDTDFNRFLLECPNLIELDLSNAFIDSFQFVPPGTLSQVLNTGFAKLDKLQRIDLTGLMSQQKYEFFRQINSPYLKVVDFGDIHVETDCQTKFSQCFPTEARQPDTFVKIKFLGLMYRKHETRVHLVWAYKSNDDIPSWLR